MDDLQMIQPINFRLRGKRNRIREDYGGDDEMFELNREFGFPFHCSHRF